MRNGEGLIIGVDLGGTKIHAAAVSETGEIVGDARCKTQPEDGADRVIERISELTRAIAQKQGGAPIEAICVGVPGDVDDEHGMVDEAPNLGWRDVPLAAKLGALTGGARVFLDNDVRVAVLGEHAHGAGRGARGMIGVWVGTGIGGGLVLDGELWRGGRGAAGEFGHMTLNPKGPRCSCGRRGHAEAYASRTAIEREVRKRIDRGEKSKVEKILKKEKRDRLTSSVVAEALADGDEVMTNVFRRAQRWLGVLCANLVNALDPEVVAIGGGLAERLGEEMVGRIREVAYRGFILERDRERVKIVATTLKDAAAPLGAAWVARRRLTPPLPHARVR
ncbi:MAG TPA: ROK family protein [Polyangia bacterium]